MTTTSGAAGQPGAGTQAMTPSGGAGSGAGGQAGAGGTASAMAGNAGVGGSGGSAGLANTGGTSGAAGSGGAGGAANDGWVKIFNGVDLTGWKAKITHYAYGDNYANTFRVQDGKLRVDYSDYQPYTWQGRFGLIYWEKPLKKYQLRVEYHFYGEQIPDPPDWGLRNSGVMIFGEDPAGVGKDVEFPRILELQMLAHDNKGNTSNGNLCPLNGASAIIGTTRQSGGCVGSTSKPFAQNPLFQNDDWIKVLVDVDPAGPTKLYFDGDNDGNPVLVFTQPQAGGVALTGGYLALQSESFPVEFRNIELKEAP